MKLNEEIIQPSQYQNNASVYTLEFGPDVREIGDHAFAGCSNLEEVIIPGNVVIVKHGAFEHCPKLHKIVLANGVQFEAGVFLDCFNLKELTIGTVVARIFPLDSAHSYIISLPEPQLTTSEYSVYVGRYSAGESHFPVESADTEQPSIYIVIINKNGIEYKWFHYDLNIALIGARFLASGKTFVQYFGFELTEQTKLSYDQFSLLVGACPAGRGVWDFAGKIIGLDPTKEYPIRLLLNVFGEWVPVLGTRLQTMIERQHEIFSYLDMKNLIPAEDVTKQMWNWAHHYIKQE